MDTTLVVIIALFAIVVVAAFIVFRSRAKVNISTPVGKVEIDATNEPAALSPGVKAEDIKSSGGGLVVRDESGRGADVKKVDVKEDVRISSTPPKSDPKA